MFKEDRKVIDPVTLNYPNLIIYAMNDNPIKSVSTKDKEYKKYKFLTKYFYSSAIESSHN